ncbi:MAG: sigma-70 family RNA polymerase sigma factor [Candidatus Riflebacteria bacterium]|nr:sigma-70 family RNA polymerase sigma factor [Candidatus Riflebacteria bacterium]
MFFPLFAHEGTEPSPAPTAPDARAVRGGPAPAGSPEDAALVVAHRQGDPRAADQLVRKYERLVKTTIWNYLRDRSLMDDLCQETFLKAFRSLDRLQQPARLKGWLLSIAYHLCVDHGRRQRLQEVSIPDDAPLPAPPQPELQLPADSSWDEKAILGFLERLPPVDGLLIWLRFVENLPYAEICPILEVTETAARKRVSRGLEFMRSCTR